MNLKNYTLKKKINILLLGLIISSPYVYLAHGHYTGKFDDEIVVVAQGTIVNKTIENVLGGKKRSGYNNYVMVVDENGVNKVKTVTRDVYYGYPLGSNITLVEKVTYIDKHNWFFFIPVICLTLLVLSFLFCIGYLGNKYLDWVND